MGLYERFWGLVKYVRNHELGGSLTTGSAALLGGFRVRVRRVFYFLVSKNVRNHELGWSLTTS